MSDFRFDDYGMGIMTDTVAHFAGRAQACEDAERRLAAVRDELAEAGARWPRETYEPEIGNLKQESMANRCMQRLIQDFVDQHTSPAEHRRAVRSGRAD